MLNLCSSLLLFLLLSGQGWAQISGSAQLSGNAQYTISSTFTETLLTDTTTRTEPSLPSMGAAGSKIVDPTFGTTILRVTDANNAPTSGEVSYSYYPTFNSNGTRIYILNGGGAYFCQFDSATFTTSNCGAIASNPPSTTLPHTWTATWSNTNPDVIYFHTPNRHVYAYNVSLQTWTDVKDFTTILTSAPFNAQTMYFQQMRMRGSTDRWFAFNLSDQPAADCTTICGFLYWDRQTDTVIKSGFTNANGNIVIEVDFDKTGTYFFAADAGPGANFYAVASPGTPLATVGPGISSTAKGFWHHDVGQNKMCTAGATSWRARAMSTPNTTIELTNNLQGDTTDEHYSLLADNELWCIVSQAIANGGTVARFGDQEIFQVATDGSGRVRRICHHRLVRDGVGDGVYAPKANPSRDGQFIAFNSNWGNANGRHDVYIVKIQPGQTS